MNTINSTDISFRSTIVPLNAKKPMIAYFNALKSCNLKSMQNMSVEECYKKLFYDAKNAQNYNAGVMLCRDENHNPALRFFGYNKENDEFIFKSLKKVDNNVRHLNDVINDGYEHGAIEILA